MEKMSKLIVVVLGCVGAFVACAAEDAAAVVARRAADEQARAAGKRGWIAWEAERNQYFPTQNLARVKAIVAFLSPTAMPAGAPESHRAEWDALARTDEGKRRIAAAEKVLAAPLVRVPPESFDEYRKTGNRGVYAGPKGKSEANLCTLVYGEALENKGRFLGKLSERGCKTVIFVEYVPVTDESMELAPGDEEREFMAAELERLRTERQDMVFVSFPGDEKSSGGCVAAGRGFFHINSHGGAEPCPFSPYSDINVRDTSLRETLNSRLFRELRDGGYLLEEHAGGCTLFSKREEVEKITEKYGL